MPLAALEWIRNSRFRITYFGKLEYAAAAALTVVLVLLLKAEFEPESKSTNSNRTTQADATSSTTPASIDAAARSAVASNGTQADLALTDDEFLSSNLSSNITLEQLPFRLDSTLEEQLLDGDTDGVIQALLQQAAKAVADNSYAELGNIVALLGSVSLLQDDPDGAAVYIDEALEIFDEQDDEIGMAGAELLRGQLNIQKRGKARQAARAYDTLQLAGWKIAHGRFAEAIPEIEAVIQTNMDLNRYGAAASGFEALYRGYQKNEQAYEAIEAGVEAAKLHAASGRTLKANRLLGQLESIGMDPERRHLVNEELHALQEDYESSVRQIGSSANFEQLYHHYINEGDPVRAWQFRVKSRESLNGVSKRAMHRRQTGVIALLFSSNDHMKSAEHALQRAQQVFIRNDAAELETLSKSLQEKIY